MSSHRLAPLSPRRWQAWVMGLLLCWLAAQGLGLAHRFQHGPMPRAGTQDVSALNRAAEANRFPQGPAAALAAPFDSQRLGPARSALQQAELPRAESLWLGHEKGVLCALFDQLFAPDAVTLPPAVVAVWAASPLPPATLQLAVRAIAPPACCARGPPFTL